jgi:hypothetical protein
MLKFLADVLDQMDLALEHIDMGSVHDARFGLMLTDNAVELVLHQIAKNQQSYLKAYRHLAEKYQHYKELEEALGRSFEAKLRFGRIEGQVTEEQSRTITIMHGFRNELYHLGLQYEPILQDLARFYLSTACGFLAEFKIGWFGYSSDLVLPDRAQKYFPQNGKFFEARRDDFPKACDALAAACGHEKATTIDSLADHMEAIISECDTCLDVVADGVYESQRRTRDKAVVECQTWPLAFTTEGRDFGQKEGWNGKSMFEFVAWLGEKYPLRVKKDPIPGWERRVKRLRSQGNPHIALANYYSFMTETQSLRDLLTESAMAAEAEIDRLIDERRGK